MPVKRIYKVKEPPEETKKRLLEALKKHNGLVSYACDSIRVNYNLYYSFYETDPEFKKAVLQIKEGTIDKVESRLFKNIEKGRDIPLIFYLKCQAKHRGYIERSEIQLGSDPKAPLVPDSFVQQTITLLMEAERKRLADLQGDGK